MIKPLSRRTVLRSAAAAFALPWLEAMAPRGLHAGEPAAAVQAAKRLVCLYVPLGVCNESWYPKQTGRDFTLSPTLEPLAKIRHQLHVVSGLHHPHGITHHAGQGSFLNGRDYNKNPGITIDQEIAAVFGKSTRFPSLQLNYNNDGFAGMSYTRDGIPLPGVGSTEAIFKRLFVPDDAASQQAARKQIAQRRSLLDGVRDEAKSFISTLGQHDRDKVEQYLFSVREVETMLDQSEAFIDRPKPTGDRAILDSEWTGPAADLRIKLNLIALALETDSTRVVSYLVDTEGSSATFPHLGLNESRHGFSHHGGDAKLLEKLAITDRFYVSELARFLERLEDAKEGERSLLDRTLVLYGSNLNNGDGFKNGTGSHVNDKMSMLLVGGNGLGLKGGQHLRCDDGSIPMCNLYLSVAQRLGLPLERFSDSTGPLAGLV